MGNSTPAQKLSPQAILKTAKSAISNPLIRYAFFFLLGAGCVFGYWQYTDRSVNEQLAAGKAALATAESDYRAVQAANSKLTGDNSRLTSQVNSLNSTVTNLSRGLDAAQATNSELTSDASAAASRLKAAAGLIDSLSSTGGSDIDQISAVIDNLGKLRKILGSK